MDHGLYLKYNKYAFVRSDFGLSVFSVGGCREQIREFILIHGIRRLFCEKVQWNLENDTSWNLDDFACEL